MSVYDDDPRVVRISGGEFKVPEFRGHWRVRLESSYWNTYDQHGEYCQEASGKDTADEAIRAVIGDPQ